MLQKIVLAGGAGYIGRVLTAFFRNKCREIVILSRGPNDGFGPVRTVHRDVDEGGHWEKELEGCDLLVNLCGKSVNCRYTEQNRREILYSRVHTTKVLGAAIRRRGLPPKVWINLSSATIYRHAEDRPQDEVTGEIGTGFSEKVCTAWEHTFFAQATPGTRKIALRAGLVLGRSDSVLPRLLNLVRLGMGGRQGSGRQFIAWIHEQDLARIIEWAWYQGADGAVYNAVAPKPVRNGEFMRTLRQACRVPVGFPVPQWVLRWGARMIGTEPELVLKSRWVIPAALMANGFVFQHPEAGPALHHLLQRKKSF